MEEELENEKVTLTVVFEHDLNNHNNKGYEVMKLLKKDLESNNHHITVHWDNRSITGLALDLNDKSDNTDWENVVMGISKEIFDSALIPTKFLHKGNNNNE